MQPWVPTSIFLGYLEPLGVSTGKHTLDCVLNYKKNPVDSSARSAPIINHGTLNEVETEVSLF